MNLTIFAAHLDRISIQLLQSLTIHVFATIFLLSITLGAVRTASANDAGSPTPAPASTPNAAPTVGLNGQPELLSLVSAGNLAELRWPSFSDYHGQAKTFYGTSGYALAWSDNGRPTPQALAIIEAFKNANLKGLNPEDYDASRWDARIAKLAPKAPSPTATDLVHFDLALTICAMRYLSDLSIGRVNPAHVKFGPQIGSKKYDLADFLRSQILPVSDVGGVIAQVEPHYAGYQRAELALAAYEKLAAQGDGAPLPMLPKGIRPGGDYAGMPQLVARLHQLGDLPAASIIPSGQTAYTSDVVRAVKQFQRRHGLDADGILGKGTIADLNTPLSQRVGELQFALERYRWIPPAFTQPPIVVNLPQFILRTMRRSGAPFLTMPVVVGKAYRKQTPVFTGNLRYVIFRPYWDVPPSIQRAELVPKLRSDRSYLASHNFEVVDGEEVVTDGAVSDAVFDELRAGRLSIRQKPGPKNSLGLVKFIFPNSYNVYLHSTPVPELFARARRDFSHGCIRVQNPLALAVWVLRNDPNWNEEKIAAAMNGDQTVKVNLAKPIPVLIIYSTAVVEPDGEVRFFDDIYHYDTALQKQLASGYPYVQSGSIATLVNNPASSATHDAY